MVMTHYMELLGASPLHLIFLMVVPMALAELLVTTEIFALIQGKESNWRKTKRIVGGLLTLYYSAVVIYVLKDVLPTIHEWRGWADKWAIYTLILAVIPLWIIALSCFFGKNLTEKAKNITHAVLLVIYLVIAHLAMIFGMADPLHTGYKMPAHSMGEMPMHHEMGAMKMDEHHQMMMEHGAPMSHDMHEAHETMPDAGQMQHNMHNHDHSQMMPAPEAQTK